MGQGQAGEEDREIELLEGDGEMRTITFTVIGDPKGKGRPRFARMGKFIKTYSPKETVSDENWVKLSYQQEAARVGWKPVAAGVPMAVRIACYFSYPQSMSAKKRAQNMYVTKRPDIDNCCKLLLDACNGLAYHDDAAIVSAHIEKLYTDGEAYTTVSISTLAED
jgi:Holliday junction resolvase RusA-like endonuclease